MTAQILRHAGTVILYPHDERHFDMPVAIRRRDADTLLVGRGHHHFTVGIRRGFDRILDQVEKNLDQLIAVAEGWRQRRIVGFYKSNVGAKSILRQTNDMVQDLMDVHRLALDPRIVGKHLHAVDQRANAVGFLNDQPGELAVLDVAGLFQQLRGAANARQRILDLVREHQRHRADRPCGAAMG